MNNRILFNYTTGDTLLLNGETYTGYYNVTDGNFYSGREVTVSSSFLEIRDNALAKYIEQKLYFNRIPLEALKLPYVYQDIKFEPSDFINQNSINKKLKRLNDNSLELFNYTATQTNDLPEGYTGFIGVTAAGAGNFGLETNIFRSIESLSNAASGLENIKRFEVIPRKTGPEQVNPDTFISIYATNTGIYAFTCPNTSIGTTYTFRASTGFVDGFNTRAYENIADITTNNKDLLFVSDIAHNQIYRLYIDPLVNDSRITGSDLEYLNLGGVEINTTGNGILSGANIIEYGLGELFTYNSGTKSIVVLDKDLTFNRRFTSKEIKDSEPVSFTINTVDRSLYILLSNFKVLKLGTDFKLPVEEVEIGNTFNPYERPKKILFSKNNSNIFYIMTTYNTYKYFNVGGNIPIGKFDWARTGNAGLTGTDNEIWDAAILDEDNDYDSLFILNKKVAGFNPVTENYSGLDKILRCNETNNRLSVQENELYVIFDLNDIYVTDQYFNSLTFNKSFKKLISNLDVMSSFIQSKFILTYDQYSELKLNTKTTLSSTLYYAKDYDMFVGPNEVVTPQVINRCINKIVDYQEYVLSVLQGRITNKKYPITEPRYINNI